MISALQAVKVSDSVYWVGAVDWGLREFHGYTTQRGTTYNAFLVMAEKITLIDTVKAPFKDELMARISSIVEPEKIDYIISNHSEMDHSGCLPQLIAETKPERVFASVNGVKALAEHFDLETELQALKTGDELDLGNLTLAFVETRMLHWPDSMVSYLKEEQVLFSQDAFGMHLADARFFDDQIPLDILEWEAEKYFANILMLYAKFILKTLDALEEMNLPIRLLAPDHGPLWRQHIDWIMAKYRTWAEQQPQAEAVIVYDTMWNSTALMARCIAEGLRDVGVNHKILPLSANNRSDVATEVLAAGAVIVGSPTINNQIFPSLSDILCYLKGLKPQNKLGAAFGSYGWSGEAVKLLNEQLDEIGIERISDGIRAKYVPDAEAQLASRELGRLVGGKLLEKIK